MTLSGEDKKVADFLDKICVSDVNHMDVDTRRIIFLKLELENLPLHFLRNISSLYSNR